MTATLSVQKNLLLGMGLAISSVIIIVMLAIIVDIKPGIIPETITMAGLITATVIAWSGTYFLYRGIFCR